MIFDSTILIDALNGHAPAIELIKTASMKLISVVTRAEVLAGVETPEEDVEARDLIALFIEIPVSVVIADAAGVIRRTSKFKIPDAMILATARLGNFELLTRDGELAAAAGTTPPYRFD